jgi:Zn-dependent metalloprotease
MINKLLVFGIVLIISFVSCDNLKEIPAPEVKKESKYCITHLRSNPDSILVSENELSIAKSLFDFNQLDYHTLQFFRVQTDDPLGYFHVRCNQFVNGLKVFNQDVIFHFKPTKKYYLLSGKLVGSIDLDTVPLMAHDTLIDLFIEQLNKDDFYKRNSYADSCFDIEFGYFNYNAFIGITEPKYIKAWKVSPKGGEYPYAFINDMTSTAFYYDNGIRF